MWNAHKSHGMGREEKNPLLEGGKTTLTSPQFPSTSEQCICRRGHQKSRRKYIVPGDLILVYADIFPANALYGFLIIPSTRILENSEPFFLRQVPRVTGTALF